MDEEANLKRIKDAVSDLDVQIVREAATLVEAQQELQVSFEKRSELSALYWELTQ